MAKSIVKSGLGVRPARWPLNVNQATINSVKRPATNKIGAIISAVVCTFLLLNNRPKPAAKNPAAEMIRTIAKGAVV